MNQIFVFINSIYVPQVIVINRELVLRGYAEWDEPTEEADSSVSSNEVYTQVVSESYAPISSEA